MTSAPFDTNIYVAAFQFCGLSARLLGMARAKLFRLDTSDAIVTEMVGVLRDKFACDGHSLQDAKQKVLSIANHVAPQCSVDVVSGDPDDNRILECAADAGSAYIVTEDKDLLRLGQYQGIQIIRAAQFLRERLN